ncbi:MAG: putative serine/threonine protein kinase [Myxococcaceae bacterium]|nr:putative serine/threonine protein kinase [Myxococcaceae bacterium]
MTSARAGLVLISEMAHASRPREAADIPAQVIAGRYRVVRLLGAGGMGSVYEVVDLASGSRLALKRLAASSTAQTRALFEGEYQTLAELQHPNIVAVYDYGLDAQGPFYTMELVQGRELSLEAPMPWREVCLCLRDVAAILSFLHARRLLHRDLSPRNLLRSPSGRLKLIDFGALARFGQAVELVGTPPFVAPEALTRACLDQRSDLFALGALGYWLLTGVHAYPARTLHELARLHEHPPPLSSSMMKPGSLAIGEAARAQLDALLAALLSRLPGERPTTAAIVIDRLHALADLAPELGELSMRGYLESNAFVGRQHELELVANALEKAQRGAGAALLIECAEGLGRTRFLRQLGVRVRLRGALALTVDAVHGQRAFAGAAQLTLGLLDALPIEARAAAQPLAQELASMSEQVRTRLAVARVAQSADAAGETRVKVQLALRALLRSLSVDRCIAILVDDLQLLDEETRSLLVTLTDGIEDTRLLVIATAASTADPTAGLVGFRSRSSTLSLLPLSRGEVLELLRSIFGDALHLARWADRLFRTSGGNPSYCLELAQQLVEQKIARYVEGAWMLPAEVGSAQLPSSRHAAQLGRVARVSAEARAVAELLSIPHDEPLDRETCELISELGTKRTEAALHELVREGVLSHSSAGYVFVHASTERALLAALAPGRRTRAQLLLGRALARAAGADGLLQLRAALQFLRASSLAEGLPLLRLASAYYGTGLARSLESLPRAAPLFEEAHGLLQARGAGDHLQALTLGTLALSSYFVDRRYEARFGAAAIEVYRRLLKVALAQRLTRFFGAKLALLIALLCAYLSLRKQAHAASLKQTIADFTAAAAALAGTATACLAPQLAHRYAAALEPFRALGKDHTINVVHDTSVLFALLVTDRVGETAAGLKTMLGRLERGEVLRDLPEGRRRDYIAGIYLSLGVQDCWKDSPEALAIADKIEHFSPMHAMTADHFRAAYAQNQGAAARAELYQQRVELHAMQLGSTWQVELWAPVDAAKTAMRLNDPLVIRHAFQDLSRLAAELPSIALEERRARGMYFMLIGHHEKAVALLELDEEPRSVIGWTFTRGALAPAHNGLGQHARAKAICEDALARRDPRDAAYPVIGLNVQIELARAESGLGHHVEARSLLEQLIEEHAPRRGAVTMGALHEARAWAALGEGQLTCCREHLAQMESWLRPTGVASLLERVHDLKRALQVLEPSTEDSFSSALRSGLREAQQITQISLRLRAETELGLAALTRAALEIAQELTSAANAFLYLPEARGRAVAQLGDQPPAPELLAWAERALLAANEDEQTEVAGSLDQDSDPLSFSFAGRDYRAVELRYELGARNAFGVLALGFSGPRTLLTIEAVRAIAASIAGHLQQVSDKTRSAE